MRAGLLYYWTNIESLYCIAQQEAGAAILVQSVAPLALAQEGARCVLACVITPSILRQALIHIITGAAVCVEAVACRAVTLVSPWVVGTVLLATRTTIPTLIHINTRLEIIIKLVALVTRANRSVAGVLTSVRASTIVILTTVDNLHLNPVALFAICTQLVGSVTHTHEGAWCVMATMGTLSFACLALVNVMACLAILS